MRGQWYLCGMPDTEREGESALSKISTLLRYMPTMCVCAHVRVHVCAKCCPGKRVHWVAGKTGRHEACHASDWEGRRRKRGKSTERPPHYITRQEICTERERGRERDRETETQGEGTIGGRASTRLMTPSSEAFHISSPHSSVVFL